MSSRWISGLRSVALDVPDLARAERFYTEVWRLRLAARTADTIYLRGSGADHHLLALHAARTLAIRQVTLRARHPAALAELARAAVAAGGRVLRGPAPLDEPGGGTGLSLRDPCGRLFQVVHGDARHTDTDEQADSPIRLAHAVLNSQALPASQAWIEQALGFTLTDRTRIMAFLNCDRDHHTLALGDADNDALNHIAFVMPSVDAVMRGGGRMRDAGHAIEWGPGRHGPGNNAFNYFIGPFGEVIEYTAEVEQIDDSYRAGGPADWTWPPGRVDQWGISAPPSAALKAAQRSVFFIPT
ncbi:VOC family protein [Aquabacterium sp. OR-4]|uniref:VOC family protein n=1 Tax=Aquabacterium sp. OR-4 TaxID=2978127 RepID=UPI0021B415EC|nr:VOC family protein [Aquabacterium sp. OR-4]MDT7837917.1 VOC family protein [Aquabacterium sp. OR-4]